MRWDALQRHGSRAAWLAARRLGASDAAKVLGHRPGAYALWRRLTGRPLPSLPMSSDQRRGLALERYALALFEDWTGHEVRRPPPFSLYGAPESWCTVTPDAFERPAKGDPWGLLEVKTDRDGSRWGPSAEFLTWGPEVAEAMPRDYALQAHLQSWALDAPWCTVVVLLPWYEVRQYKLHRDPELEAVVVGALRDWYELHVEQGVPVAREGTALEARDIAERTAPTGGAYGATRQATADEAAVARQLHYSSAFMKQAEASRKGLSNWLCERAGRAGSLQIGRDGEGGRISIVRTGGTVFARVHLKKPKGG